MQQFIEHARESPNRKMLGRAESGLLEGYALGSTARLLRLPTSALAAAKSAPKNIGLPQSRTPLKTITQVMSLE